MIVDYSTCLRTRPIDHGPISGPSEGVEAFSGFVSNRNNSMMRCRLWCALCLYLALGCNLHIPAAWHGTRVYDESQIVNLKRRSDPSTGLGADNRMYYEPSAQRRIRFYWTRMEEISVVWVPLLPESSEWSTGIVFGGRGKRGDPSCRGGGADACSLFGARDFKEASLLYLPSRSHCIVVYSGCPSAGDNGNGRMLAVTWPAGRTLLIKATSLHCALFGGCQHGVRRIQIKERQARSSSNLLCFGRGGEQILWMVTGVVRGLREAVSYHKQFNHINTNDYVSRPHTHRQSCSRERRSYPACSPLESSAACSPLESSHPYVHFPSCIYIVTHGGNVASNVSPPTERSIMCNYFNAAYICVSTVETCHRTLIVNSGSYFLIDLPRSSCKHSILGGLAIRFGAKPLHLAECQVPRVEMCVTIFESPLRLGVLAKGSCVFASMRKSVPTMLQRSMTFSLYPARGPTPPQTSRVTFMPFALFDSLSLVYL